MMFPLDLKNTLIAGGAALVIGFSTGWYVHTKFVAADQLKELQDQVDAYKTKQGTADAAAKAWEKQLADEREKNRKLNRRLQNEINSNPIYSSCTVPADGVRALSDAVSGGDSTGKPDE